jgi:hypothetical protein
MAAHVCMGGAIGHRTDEQRNGLRVGTLLWRTRHDRGVASFSGGLREARLASPRRHRTARSLPRCRPRTLSVEELVVRISGRLCAVAAATLFVASACDDPQSPKPAALLLTPTYPLAVSVATTGFGIDPDGYVVWVDDTLSQPVGANGMVTFSMPAGPHEVAIYGVASNCTVNGYNPRMVWPGADMVAATAFSVSCVSQGDVFVSTTTTGVDLDPDGYTATVDGSPSQAIATNGGVTFTGVAAGAHSVALSGIAGNCSVSGSNPQSVTVAAGATASAPFSLSCAPTGSGSGKLIVTTSTTGSNLDPDGYTLTVDGTLSQPIATNGSVTVTVPAGANPVALSGVAQNCAVSGANPVTITVPAGGAATTTFSVTCGAPPAEVSGQGQLGMGPATPGNDVQVFAFDVRGNFTGRVTITDYNDIHPSGNPASLTTDPAADPATSFTAYRTRSTACSDPSRGVEFDGVGREDEGSLVSYTVQVCDNGPAGSGSDFLSIFIPSEGYGHSGSVTSGDIVKR